MAEKRKLAQADYELKARAHGAKTGHPTISTSEGWGCCVCDAGTLSKGGVFNGNFKG